MKRNVDQTEIYRSWLKGVSNPKVTLFRKWKMSWADHFSWLRDEYWYRAKLDERLALVPLSGVITHKTVETHHLEGNLIAHIEHVTLRDARAGYSIHVFEPAPPDADNGFLGFGHSRLKLYSSVEEARRSLEEEAAYASAQIEWRVAAERTAQETGGLRWMPYLEIPDKHR
jgi:hypothetical protein